MLRHAESALKASRHSSPAERIQQYETFLKIENRRLFSLHRAKAGGLEVARGRSVMMDTLLHYIFQNILDEHFPEKENGSGELAICLLATGGYGRGELNPFSDVDILFLLPTAKGPELARVNTMVEQVLYVLWDLGLKVGHATRTVQECLKQAEKDMQSRTALSEARLLEGSKAIFKEFQQAIYRECVKGNFKEYITNRMEDQIERHKKHGNTVFVQEPNVKNGCGGLRDVQNLLWISRFKFGAGTLEELKKKDMIAQIEAGRLHRAYDFLMRVRNELHYSNNRAVDEITLPAQPKIAYALGYHQKDVLRQIEIFMRDYYRHARDIYVLTESLAERLALDEESRPGRLSRIFSIGKKTEKLEGGLYLRKDVLEVQPGAPLPHDALDLMQIFRVEQLRNARIGAGLQSVIRRQLKFVNREFQYSKRGREVFLSILRSKGEVGRILRSMHECGFLGEYIPEFGALDCLVQHEFYHRYTADEHTLVAIEKLDEILNAQQGSAAKYSRIFKQLENPHILYLAILLHDAGKAVRTRHHSDASAECAHRVARRLCLDYSELRLLVWLVDNHMTMSQTVQRRDIEDSSTISDFVALVGKQEWLDMLHLLTFVDGLAVGSTNFSEWRQQLLWQLYDRASKGLGRSGVDWIDLETHKAKLHESARNELEQEITADEIQAHFTHMPARYWSRIHKDELVWHLRVLHSFLEKLFEEEAGTAPSVVQWKHYPDRDYSEVVVCTWDRHGLFSKIAGSFAASRINILNADIYTRSDDIALDIFQVCNLEHRSLQDDRPLQKMISILTDSLRNDREISFSELILEEYEAMRHMPHQDEECFPTTVGFNNHDSSDYSILEIQTPDRLGLLHQILKVLTECDLDIDLAKINTEKGAAMDVFYLTDSQGQKISNAETLALIQSRLKETIDRLNRPFRGVES